MAAPILEPPPVTIAVFPRKSIIFIFLLTCLFYIVRGRSTTNDDVTDTPTYDLSTAGAAVPESPLRHHPEDSILVPRVLFFWLPAMGHCRLWYTDHKCSLSGNPGYRASYELPDPASTKQSAACRRNQ